MNPGERIVASCDRWLSDGPLGDRLNGDAYRRLISCGFVPPLVHPSTGLPYDGDIGTIKTSCAVFARAILHDSGVLLATKRGRSGWPMWGGWLGVLSPRHRAWIPYREGSVPMPGALFYVEAPKNPNNNHVGFFVSRIGSNNWRTAEGGGGDGTKCAFTEREVTRWQKTRQLIGWFDPALIGAGDDSEDDTPTKPETPHSLTPVATRRILMRSMSGADVAEWQAQLRKDGWAIAADGIFGTQTHVATSGWQAARRLEPDGVVGPKTRAAIGTPPRRASSTSFPAVKP